MLRIDHTEMRVLQKHPELVRTLSRRGLLRCGAFGLAGLTLPDLLRARAIASTPSASKARSGILIWLGGGPSHHDSFDPKPEAPAVIRGEHKPIETEVPGIQFAESVPRLAAAMKKLAVIRTLTHRQGAHETGSAYMISGYDFQPGHNFASIGGAVNHEHQQRAQQNGLPPYLAIPDETIRGGHVIGRSDEKGAFPKDRPVTPEERFYSMCELMGVDPEKFVRAANGREIQLVREGKFIPELTS